MRLDQELVRRIAVLEKQFDDLVKPERGWSPHFLTTPYTNADFNGDSFSDVGANTKIENTSWSTTIPATAKALLVYGYVRDSGSAGATGLFFALYPAAGATQAALNWTISGRPNDDYQAESGVVPCTDGDIWYQCDASGANTMDVYLFCWGWWE